MPRTTVSSPPDSTAVSSKPELPPRGGRCTIHQPNLFPRLTTLAKLFAADYWIVLDNVQFTRRDYQQRARLTALGDPPRQQWLTVPTHLPQGRRTVIHEAVIVDPDRSRRRVAGMLTQYYSSSPHWSVFRPALDVVLERFDSGKTAEVAETSTRVLLRLLGWTGQILRSSELVSRPGRSQRLADLAAGTGARSYLCGSGGMTYLRTEPFDARGVSVVPFRTPAEGIWASGRENSALTPLLWGGFDRAADELHAVAARHSPAKAPAE